MVGVPMGLWSHRRSFTGGNRENRGFDLFWKSQLPLLSPVRVVSPVDALYSMLTETVIGAAIEVHRNKGPGLIESIY
jgi:hypothetical protein